MAIFNEEYLHELGTEWHGKTFLEKKELLNPNFRREQTKKMYDILNKASKSVPFAKEFSAKPTFVEYFKDPDDDAAYVFGNFVRGHDRVLGVLSFSKDDVESGTAKDSANFFIKAFESAKKDDKKLFGKLKYTEADGALDYKL